MAIENPTSVRLSSDDALTLAYALELAWRLVLGQTHEVMDSGFLVRLRMKGRGDADVEQEYERLMNLLGYDA